jgi:hypothetical protein
MINVAKRFPCGHKIEVQCDTWLTKVIVSTETKYGLGMFITENKQEGTIMIRTESLPMIREILDEIDPQPWPYRFLNSIRKRWYS